jgi:hypothetical protein
LREAGIPVLAFVAGHLYLDQLVALEVEVDLAQHRIGQAFAADHHDRVQAVGARFEGFALYG